MTRQEFAVLAKAIRAVYPNMLPDDGAKDVWYGLLADLDYNRASVALQTHMMTSRFPPTIADIREKAVRAQGEDLSELDAWAMARRAIRHDPDNAREQFARLPETVQRTLGTYKTLCEWGELPSDTVGSVIQSQFLRGYRVVLQRTKEEAKLSPALRMVISGGAKELIGEDKG